MPEFLAPVVATVMKNPFFQGGFILAISTSVIAIFRSKISGLFGRLRAMFMYRVKFPLNSDVVKWYFATHHANEQVSLMSVEYKVSSSPTSNDVSVVLSPRDGTFYIPFKGKKLQASFSTTNNEQNGNETNDLIISYFGWNGAQLVNDFLNHVAEEYKKFQMKTSMVPVYSWSAPHSYWSHSTWTAKRDPKTVVCNGVVDEIVQDIQSFLSKKDWYTEVGIPHQRGYILYGPPGNGKTTIIRTIASVLGYGICKFSNEQIITLGRSINALPKNTILVIEDVDATIMGKVSSVRDKNGQDSSEITVDDSKPKLDEKSTGLFSDVLNAIDGLVVTELPRIIIMTTNHIDKLDPALLRPGRIDKKIYVGNATKQNIREMYERFFPNAPSGMERFVAQYEDHEKSMAFIQGELLMMREGSHTTVRIVENNISTIPRPVPTQAKLPKLSPKNAANFGLDK